MAVLLAQSVVCVAAIIDRVWGSSDYNVIMSLVIIYIIMSIGTLSLNLTDCQWFRLAFAHKRTQDFGMNAKPVYR